MGRTRDRPATRGATIADVAQRAGVGVSTVSRVLNDGQVSVPARARVLSAMSDLGYRPRASARALASGSTQTLGMVIPFFTHPSAVERVRGVLAAVDEAPFDLVVCNVSDPAQRDELRGGRLATEHLIELGHERIAFVGDTADPGFGFVASERRLAGYREALEAAGIPLRDELQRFGPHGRRVAHRLTRELVSLPQPPTAIFAASDTQALGVLEAARAEGLEVPGDLSLVGFDDVEVAPYVGLTTVAQPLYESGRRGLERLLEVVAGADDGPLTEQLELRLVVRRTTASPN
jgi:LacI family transcriptional regulator